MSNIETMTAREFHNYIRAEYARICEIGFVAGEALLRAESSGNDNLIIQAEVDIAEANRMYTVWHSLYTQIPEGA